jgi:general secretion pathway protein L
VLREFFDWWIGQLAGLVPERIRRSLSETEEGLLVEPELAARGGPLVRLARYGSAGTGELGRFPLDAAALGSAAAAMTPGPVRLRLPADLLLEKELSLPLAAQRELDRVVAYELDRETPFSAEEAWWDYTVVQRDRQHARLTLRLSLVPKSAIERLLAVLAEARIAPTMLDLALDGGETRSIAIGAPHGGAGAWGGRSVPVAASACLLLLIAAIVLPFARQSWEIAAVQSRISALKANVDEAEKLRRELQQAGGSEVVQTERARVGDPLAVLSAATTLLPDDTHLTDFTMSQRKVTLNGQSVGPARLIGAFAADPTFKDPAFAAPSTHIEGQHTDTFSIGAEARS